MVTRGREFTSGEVFSGEKVDVACWCKREVRGTTVHNHAKSARLDVDTQDTEMSEGLSGEKETMDFTELSNTRSGRH